MTAGAATGEGDGAGTPCGEDVAITGAGTGAGVDGAARTVRCGYV